MSCYGIIISSSILICSLLAERLVDKKYHNILWGLVLWGVVGGIVGSRIYHVLNFLPYYTKHPYMILDLRGGGLGIWGGILGGLISVTIYLRRNKQSVLPWLNLAGLLLPLGQAIGRLGNYFNQELFGPPTYLPWGIYIKPENRPIEYIKYQNFHPLFLYESVLNITLFFILFKLWKNQNRDKTFFYYLIGYSSIRFFLEYLRINPWTIFGLNVAQCTSILVIIIVSFVLIKKKNK